MNVAGLIGGAAGCCLVAAAAAGSWRGRASGAGPARSARWWFAAAAVCVLTNLVAGQAALFPAGSAMTVLSFADLPGFLALPAIAVGLGLLAVGRPGRAASPGRTSEPLLPRRGRRLAAQAAFLVDGYLLASALLLTGWVTVFGPVFGRYGGGAATFAAELVHPLADLVFLAVVLAAAGAAGGRGLVPYLALAALAVADSLSVGARITGSPPGVAAVSVQVLALALLALAAWEENVRPPAFLRAAGAPVSTAGAAAAAASAAAAVAIGQAIAVGRQPEPVVLILLGTTVVVLGGRVAGLVTRVNSWVQLWQESGRRFRQLAERTSDVVLICDLDGVIRFASGAVGDYGYSPESLAGVAVTDLLHPEDRAGGARALRGAVAAAGQRPSTHSCRVRAADGTWRHVEAAVSRYHDAGGPGQLLVTARDVSAQVELRRQITYLTSHDVLTGLPNRAYLERRTRAALGQAGAGELAGARAAGAEATAAGTASPVPAGGPAVLAIMLGVDGFAAFCEAGGRGGGDLLLAQIARRLRLIASPQDTVARWSSAEFAVLIEGGPAPSPATGGAPEIPDIAQRLARSLPSQPFQLGSGDVTVTVSVGVAFAGGGTAAGLWRSAELAMAQARELGGDRVAVFRGLPPAGGPAPGGGPPEAAAAGAAA